ncbi:Histidine kinase 1 [Capsicum baccatum]|uniref:histidine kinase n=1 Tax=Capsicum baccatum TaxID=33114 RepID=A0A2G2WBR7_CAPBA|nr:Histidine kinase 1 [Capsicum baccatum]
MDRPNYNISAIWYREPLDPSTGERNGKRSIIPPNELINIAGISQVPDGAASWHVAMSKYTDSLLLSAALPVWDPSNKTIVSVVGVTTALHSVGQLMKEIVEFHSGHIYLTSQEGWLLTTSTNSPLLMNTTKGPMLMMAIDSEDPVIRAGAECLQMEYGDRFPPSQEVHIENAKLGNQVYYIDSFFLQLRRLPMVGVIIIPRKHIMGKEDKRAIKTLSRADKPVRCKTKSGGIKKLQKPISSEHENDSWSAPKVKLKRLESQEKKFSKKDNKMILWFEVEDFGCGIDPSKRKSVFESFEQVDPSTTHF